MPMDRKCLKEYVGEIMAFRFVKRPCAEEICASFDDVSKSEPGRLRLWDFTCGLDLASEDIQKIVDYANTLQIRPGKAAIVAPQDLVFGLSRVYAAYREDKRIQLGIFRSESEAVAWLTK